MPVKSNKINFLFKSKNLIYSVVDISPQETHSINFVFAHIVEQYNIIIKYNAIQMRFRKKIWKLLWIVPRHIDIRWINAINEIHHTHMRMCRLTNILPHSPLDLYFTLRRINFYNLHTDQFQFTKNFESLSFKLFEQKSKTFQCQRLFMTNFFKEYKYFLQHLIENRKLCHDLQMMINLQINITVVQCWLNYS